MSRHVMVPLDGSPFAESALSAALSQTRAPGDVLELVMVQEVNAVFALEAWEEAFSTAAQSYLDDLCGRFDPGLRDVRTTVLVGRPALELARRAEETETDLVVMSTHGRGALTRMWLGSVADELIRHTHKPILLVRPPEGEAALDDRSEPLFRRVLVPLDGSPHAEAALEAVADTMEGSQDDELTLVRIVRYPDELISTYVPSTVSLSQQLVEEGLQESKAYLEKMAAGLRERGFTVETHTTVESRPAAAILDLAEKRDVDLIAMATHGRGGVPRAVMGSVTDKVVRGAHVPVLVVHPAQDDERG